MIKPTLADHLFVLRVTKEIAIHEPTRAELARLLASPQPDVVDGSAEERRRDPQHDGDDHDDVDHALDRAVDGGELLDRPEDDSDDDENEQQAEEGHADPRRHETLDLALRALIDTGKVEEVDGRLRLVGAGVRLSGVARAAQVAFIEKAYEATVAMHRAMDAIKRGDIAGALRGQREVTRIGEEGTALAKDADAARKRGQA